MVISGSLKGSGRQYIGAVMVFIGYYIVGLPVGALLALKFNMGALGLWIGMAFGNSLHVGYIQYIQAQHCIIHYHFKPTLYRLIVSSSGV